MGSGQSTSTRDTPSASSPPPPQSTIPAPPPSSLQGGQGRDTLAQPDNSTMATTTTTTTTTPSNSLSGPDTTALTEAAKAEGEWTPSTAARFEAKGYSQYMDPCQEAADRSLQCLRRNSGDRDMCLAYFQAYRECKKVWLEERKRQRRANGSWW